MWGTLGVRVKSCHPERTTCCEGATLERIRRSGTKPRARTGLDTRVVLGVNAVDLVLEAPRGGFFRSASEGDKSTAREYGRKG